MPRRFRAQASPGLAQLVAGVRGRASTCRRSSPPRPAQSPPPRTRRPPPPTPSPRTAPCSRGLRRGPRAAARRRAHRAVGRPPRARACRWSAPGGCSAASSSRAGRRPDLAAARLIAGVAAQAVEAARMWESGAAGSGTVDLLTGLPNHRGFSERAARELSRAKRTGSVVALGIVDIDGFGALNDVQGHASGDALLRTAARCFADGVRSYDSVCRLGRDEFGLVLPGMTSIRRRHADVAARPGVCHLDRRRHRLGRRRRASHPTAPPTASSSGSRPGRSTGPSAAAAGGSSPTTPASSRRCRPASAPTSSSATPTSAPSARSRPPTATRRPPGR